jgi:hypothetical protein
MAITYTDSDVKELISRACPALSRNNLGTWLETLRSDVDGTNHTISAGTISQYFRGDKTFQTLDKSAIGLSDVDNTSDLNKPLSLLDQSIQWSNNSLSYISGTYYDNAPLASNSLATAAGSVNLITYHPFITSRPFSINRIGLAMTVIGTAGLGNITLGIYTPASNGYPGALVGQVEITGFNTGVARYVYADYSFTFQPGFYWFAIFHSTDATYRVMQNINLNLGMSDPYATYANYYPRTTRTYNLGLPNPVGWTSTDRSSASAHLSLIRMRCA